MNKRNNFIQASFDFESSIDLNETQPAANDDAVLPWIEVAKGIPYFITDKGDPWTPIGQNDGITWPDLSAAFQRKDLAAVESYCSMLKRQGVNCLRLMLEYSQDDNRYLEKPVGNFRPNMVRMWDDIFLLCEKHSLRILLTPFDTFWMWHRWSRHPYNSANNGPCSKRSQWLLCPRTRDAIKQRLYFATQRWGSSGALFAWDLWNEIRPAHIGNSARKIAEWVDDIGGFLRSSERALHGKAHLQTVSVFSSLLQKNRLIADSVFRHPALDFATMHFYDQKGIDNPKNTIDAAKKTGHLTRQVIDEINDDRPFLDSEHGPIKTFNDHGKTLPADFDDEYFRHMQWAHFASGGAGGGMRWPYRYPHVLTTGMRNAQLALSRFIPLISWKQFNRKNLNDEIMLSDPGLAAFGCGDEDQAIIWLLRTNAVGKNKMVNTNVQAAAFDACIPLLNHGRYHITLWDTRTGLAVQDFEMENLGKFTIRLPGVATDLAIAIRKM